MSMTPPPAHRTFVLFAIACLAFIGSVMAEDVSGPRFRADGPSAVAYGMNDGYPKCEGLAYIRNLSCRVGAFSHYDGLFPSPNDRRAQTVVRAQKGQD